MREVDFDTCVHQLAELRPVPKVARAAVDLVNDDALDVRALAYELFSEHQRKKTVARILNERGYRTRSGALFTDSAVGRMIEDPAAKGQYRANYTTVGENGVSWQLKPEDEWIWTDVDAIISEELWDRCNGILAARSAGRRPAKKTRYLFAGFALCQCGAKMYVPARRNKYVCAGCLNKIPVDDLETLFRSELEDFLLSPEELDAHHTAANEMLREKQLLIEAADSELKKIVIAENELFDLYHAGELAKADFGRRHKPISERRAQIEDELPRLEAERDVLRIGMLSRDEVLDDARDLAGKWPDLPWEHRRQIVETITDRIVIGKEGVEITLLQMPSGKGDALATEPRRF